MLLDEAWLRGRRELVHALERNGFWPSRPAYLHYLERQVQLGNRLQRIVLAPLLDADEAAALNSEGIFGTANDRVRRRLPLSLAFGHELGRAFHSLLGGDPTVRREVARACGLFNLGITTFDLLIDGFPDLFERFSSVFDEPALAAMAGGYAARDLEHTVVEFESMELRIMYRIIAGFFASPVVMNGGQGPLLEHLRQAYRAELRSARPETANSPDAVDVCRAKSALPFKIIGTIAASAATLEPHYAVLYDALVTDIGMVFWLVDDLLDTVSDFRSGALNGLLIEAGWRGRASLDVRVGRRIMTRLLSGGAVERTADNITTRLASAFANARSNRFKRKAALELETIVSAYVRCWVE